MSNQSSPCDTAVCIDLQHFSGLNEEDAATVAAIGSVCEVPENTDLFTAFEPADHMYIVLEGRISLATPVPGRSHAESVVATVSRGELLGWSALLPDHVWQTSARTLKPCRLIQLPGPELRELCEQNTDIGFQLTKKALEVADQRVSACHLQVLDIFGQPDA